jgi:hypothetical protein
MVLERQAYVLADIGAEFSFWERKRKGKKKKKKTM